MKFSAFAATLAVAVVVPTSVAAASPVVTPQVVTPQVVKPQVVKPQVVKPQPVAPAPEPEASPVPRSVPGSAPSPAPSPPTPPSHSPVYGPSSGDGPPAENEVPGSDIPGSPTDPPYPEGRPAHWEPGCDLDCLQEWYEWYDARRWAVKLDSLNGGSAADKLNAQLLADEVAAIEAAIADIGKAGDFDDHPSGEQVHPPSGLPQTSPGEAIVSVFPQGVVKAINDAIDAAIGEALEALGAGTPDAITSAGAITPRDGGVATPPDASTPQEVDLGSWDLTKVVDAAAAVSGVEIASAIAKGLAAISGVCSGPKIQDKPEFCPQ